jgi:RNA 3'-terminal phosphate cyclase (ATP)
LFAPSHSTLILKGGTDADFAPPIDFFRFTFLHYAKLFGISVNVDRVKRGFFPKGCGEVAMSIEPVKYLTPVNITERGQITNVTVSVYLCGTLPSSIGERCLHTAQNMVQRRFSETKVPVNTQIVRDEGSFGNGWGLRITAETSLGCRLTSTGNGNPKTTPERLAGETAEQLIKDIDEGGCVDCHMQDQLIIFMGLASGVSRVRTGPLTLHTKTAIHLVERLTSAQFTVTKEENGNLGEQSYIIECKGIGVQNVYLA